MAEPLKQVNISDFEVGQSLPGDIVDGQEKILFRQGLKLTKDILAAWQRRGMDHSFYERVRPTRRLPGLKLTTKLLRVLPRRTTRFNCGSRRPLASSIL